MSQRLVWYSCKKFNKPLIQKDWKNFIINLFNVNDQSNSVVVRLNQIMSNLLTLNKCLRLNCLEIATLFFEHAKHFRTITWGYCMVESSYQYFKKFVFKEPIKVVPLQILANQLRFNSALLVEIINKPFVKAAKDLIVW